MDHVSAWLIEFEMFEGDWMLKWLWICHFDGGISHSHIPLKESIGLWFRTVSRKLANCSGLKHVYHMLFLTYGKKKHDRHMFRLSAVFGQTSFEPYATHCNITRLAGVTSCAGVGLVGGWVGV